MPSAPLPSPQARWTGSYKGTMRHSQITALEKQFPRFACFLADRRPVFVRLGLPGDKLLPPVSVEEIDTLEAEVGVPLPTSYREFLGIARGILLMGGEVSMYDTGLFFRPEPLPGAGMLCFADFWMEDDGGQVLFDVRAGLNGDEEYPVLYYAHDVPAVTPLAASFRDWLERVVPDEGR